MVSHWARCGVGSNPRCAPRCRCHPKPGNRWRELPGRSPRRTCQNVESADRHTGRHADESLQSLARRPRGEILRTVDAAVAADFGDAFPANADRGTRARDRPEFCGRPDRGRWKHIFGEPAHGIRRTWLRSVALNHAGHEVAPLLTRRDLSRRTDDWLAGIGTLPARRAGYDDRCACARRAQARTACDYMRVTQPPTNQVQIEE